MNTKHVLLVVLSFGLASISFASGSVKLIGSDFGGVIYDVDPATGTCSNPRSMGLSGVAGFTVTGDGQHAYALTSFGSAPPNALFRVNAVTGATEFIGSTGLSLVGEGDLCIRPSDGTLFALWNATGADLHMFTINPSSGAATDVGIVATATDLSGLAFAPNGSLYCFENGTRLRQLDPNNGATLNIINLTGIDPATGVAGMAFAPDGTFYIACNAGAGPSLYTADLGTGAMQRLGATIPGDGLGLSSLTVIPIPEPTSGALLVLGMALAVCRLRKR